MLFCYGPKGELRTGARVGKNNVNMADVFLDRRVEAIEVGWISHVTLYASYVRPNFFNGSIQFLFSSARHKNMHTFLCQEFGRRQANTTTTSRDNPDFSLQPICHIHLSLLPS